MSYVSSSIISPYTAYSTVSPVYSITPTITTATPVATLTTASSITPMSSITPISSVYPYTTVTSIDPYGIAVSTPTYVPSVVVNDIGTVVSNPIVHAPSIAVPLASSLDLNKNHDLRKEMTNFFYYKTIDKWLSSDMSDLLNYLKVGSKGVELLNKLSEYSPDNSKKDTEQDHKLKIEYIENKILSKENIYKILKKFVSEERVNWFDLEDKSFFIKDLIKKFTKKKLEYLIQEKNN